MAQNKFIVIDRRDADGFQIDADTYQVNTAEEIAEAEEALRDAGLTEADVWAGDDEDSVKTGTKIFA